MKSGTMFNQGDILLVPFPFSDLSGVKSRPVLILSNDSYNSKSSDLITCGITSNLSGREYSVLIDNNNLSEGRIPAASMVKVDKIFTLDKSIIKKRLCRMDAGTFNEVKSILLTCI